VAEGRTAFPVDPDGWYVEPVAATEFLLRHESFDGMTVWDPACGQGNIVLTMRRAQLQAYGSDIKDRSGERSGRNRWFVGVHDFLAETIGPSGIVPSVMAGAAAIVCNPPYGRAKLAEAFIRKALSLDLRKVCFFVNAKFMFSTGRSQGLFGELPPTRVYPVWPRPSCPPGALLASGEIKAEGGVENYVWMVWDRDPPNDSPIKRAPEIIWREPVRR
jgi:hypothetical protein